MTTAILSALPQEQSTLVHRLARPQRVTHAGRAFWTGDIEGRAVVLALSGIGKVAAATTATALIERFGAARILFTGVAGGIGDGVQVGDVVVASDYLQHDMDASPLFPRWEVPGYGGARMACDTALTAMLSQAASAFLERERGVFALRDDESGGSVPRVHQGLLASGDRFVSAAQEAHALRTSLRTAGHPVLAVEMEGAAVAQVCADYRVPFAAMRTISDRADDTAHVDFSRFVATVASRYADHIVMTWLRLL